MNSMLRQAAVAVAVAVALASTAVFAQGPARQGPIPIAVAERDIEAIVIAVGGNQVDTFSLFRGCILRKDLAVEASMKERLARAEAIVWTGFLGESGAISKALGGKPALTARSGDGPKWIDVSTGASRVNIPTSDCYGSGDAAGVSGDPFFWLNPQNGHIIARNLAHSLGDLRPDKRTYFLANAEAFRLALDKDIARWKEELKPLAKLRVFSAQCGWQNFSRIGGPVFAVCKATPGSLPTPTLLLDHIKQMKAQLVVLDPNTPPEYARALREESGLTVVEVPSSIQDIPGAKSYAALFDNFVHTLLRSAGQSGPAAKR